MTRYGRYLGPRLKERLEEYLEDGDTNKLLKLNDEIALSRTMLAEQIQLMSAVVEKTDVEAATKQLALGMVREGINHVAELCAKAARVYKDTADRVTVEQLNSFVMQMTKIVNDEIKDDDTRAALLHRLDKDLRLLVSNDADAQAQRVRQTLLEMEETTGGDGP